MSPPDFDKIALSTYDKLGIGPSADTRAIRAALEDAYNAALEDGAMIADAGTIQVEGGITRRFVDGGWIADMVRARKIVKEG